MSVTANLFPPDYEPVPTLPELANRGLARVMARNGSGEPTHLRPTPKGEAILRDTMRRNAERCKAWSARRATT